MGSAMFEGTEPGGPLAPELAGPPRRALIMAGGGLKVAFQAGVLQVWLDEARDGGEPLEFMHADGASGGVFNLAMWCQGMSGRRIADNWRRCEPLRRGMGLNWRGWPRGESLLTMERFRTGVLRDTWGLDWRRIRATERSAGFNVFDVDAGRLVTVAPSAMSEDLLVAATSLPFWYPPVPVQGRNYIDGVFLTDANLDAAIAAGADELWVVWTVSTAGRWRHGPVAQYFQVIEACANGALRRDLDRVARSNQAHAAGLPAEFPHPVRIMALEQEVPLHYLLVFSRRRLAGAVDLGVARAREWCRARGFEVRDDPVPLRGPGGLGFRERMSGPVAFGRSAAPVAAALGDARGDRMTLQLQVEIDDLAAFEADRRHRTRVSGSVDCAILGGTMPIERGSLALLPETGAGPGTTDRRGTTMEYRLDLADSTGRALTLVGVKAVRDDPGPDMWSDTTTLDVALFPRQPAPDDPHDADHPHPGPVLAGRLRMTPLSFLRVLSTVRSTAADRADRHRTVAGFGAFFLRRLAAVYLRGGPVDAPRPASSPAPIPTGDWPDGYRPADAHVVAYNERIVPAPPERVWDLLVDASGWSRYYPNAQFVDVEGGGRLQLRSVFHWVTFGLPITSTVDVHETCRTLGWVWHGFGAHGYHIWSLRPDPHGTRVVTAETQRGFLPWLLKPVLRRLLPLGHELWLRRLARQASRPSGT